MLMLAAEEVPAAFFFFEEVLFGMEGERQEEQRPGQHRGYY